MAPVSPSGVLKRFRIALIRLPLNLRSNRWFVIAGRTFYIHSQQESRSYTREVTQHSLATGSSAFRVYRRALSFGHMRAARKRSNDALLLPNLGRFGNAVREVVRALAVARSFDIGHVHLAEDNVFCSSS